MGKVIIALIVTIVFLAVGLKENAKWRVKVKRGESDLSPSLQKMIKRGKLGLMGIGPVFAPILFALGVSTAAVICLGITLLFALFLLPRLLIAKLPLKLLGNFLLVGAGDVSRGLLIFTLIGIPIVKMVDYQAEIGMERYLKELAAQSRSREAERGQQESLGALLLNSPTGREIDDGNNQQSEVKVWRENGYMNEHLKVSSDGERYFDPEDGEWHRIKK